MDALLRVLIVTFVASLQGIVCYLILREAEKKFAELPYLGVSGVCMMLYYLSTSSYTPTFVAWYHSLLALWQILLAIALCSVLGGWLHRRTGGASKTFWDATFLMLTVIFIGQALRGPFLGMSQYFLGDYYVVCLLFFPTLAPFIVSAFKSLQLRPGLDRPMREGEYPTEP